MSATNVTAIRGGSVTLQAATDAFLSSPRCENANTRRAYAGVIDKVVGELGSARHLADVADAEIPAILERLWATAGEATWNRNRAAINAWLTWCRDKQSWPGPALPGSCERRREHVDATKDLPKATIERRLSRRDVPLREKMLWRMLYETAARASEILALNVEQLDLENRRAPIRSKGGETEWVYWGTGTAHLLPRLLRLPDGSTRTSGPLFLASRKPVPARGPGRATSVPTPATPGYDRARILLQNSTGWQLHQLRHSAATHLGEKSVPLQLIMAKTRHKSPSRPAQRCATSTPGPPPSRRSPSSWTRRAERNSRRSRPRQRRTLVLSVTFRSAGINRHGEGNERFLHRRISEPRWPRAMRWRS